MCRSNKTLHKQTLMLKSDRHTFDDTGLFFNLNLTLLYFCSVIKQIYFRESSEVFVYMFSCVRIDVFWYIYIYAGRLFVYNPYTSLKQNCTKLRRLVLRECSEKDSTSYVHTLLRKHRQLRRYSLSKLSYCRLHFIVETVLSAVDTKSADIGLTVETLRVNVLTTYALATSRLCTSHMRIYKIYCI